MTKQLIEVIQHTRKQQHEIQYHIEEVKQKVIAQWEEQQSNDTFYNDISHNLELQQAQAAQAKAIFCDPKYEVHYSLKENNKMPILLEQAKKIIADEPKIPYLDENLELGKTLPIWKEGENTNPLWGTSKLTAISTTMTALDIALSGKNISQYSLNSSIHHVAPLKDNVTDSLSPSPWIYNVAAKPIGYGFVHSGFAYGGSRFQESLYPHGKEWQPEDSSSYVTKYIVPEATREMGCTTSDYFWIARAHSATMSVPQQLLHKPEKQLIEYLSPIKPENVSAGDIWIMRTGISNNLPLGIYGTMGIVVEVKGNKIDVLQATRNMPMEEGIGIKEKDIVSRDNSASVFYLREKNTAPLTEAFSIQNIIELVDDQMENHIFLSVYTHDEESTLAREMQLLSVSTHDEESPLTGEIH